MPYLYVYWEKASSRRYYQVTVSQDLLGDVIVTQRWGTQGTRLGNRRQHVCPSYEAAIKLVMDTHRRRLKHHYQLMQSDGILLPKVNSILT